MTSPSSWKPTDLLNFSSSVRSPCYMELARGETAWLTVWQTCVEGEHTSTLTGTRPGLWNHMWAGRNVWSCLEGRLQTPWITGCREVGGTCRGAQHNFREWECQFTKECVNHHCHRVMRATRPRMGYTRVQERKNIINIIIYNIIIDNPSNHFQLFFFILFLFCNALLP